MKKYEQNGSRNAFTLIELVVSIVIMAIVAGITIHYLVSASRLYVILLAQKQTDREVIDAVSRLRRETRLIVRTIAADSNQWAFSNTYATVNTCRWYRSDVLLNNNRLATGIERCVLTYYDATNGLTTNCALIRRVALEIKATNNTVTSEFTPNFFLQEDLLK